MKTVYHYTNKIGFDAITTGNNWYPSTMKKHNFSEPLSSVLTLDSTLAMKLYYEHQFEQHDYREKKSTQFRDINYGPGWYVTDIPPTAKTNYLLNELWQGNDEYIDNTEYWLKINVENKRLKQPDENRETVYFLPIFDHRGFDTNRPAGWSTSPVLLVEAGYRDNSTVKQVNLFKPPLELLPSFINVIDGWSSLNPDHQCNALGYFAMDSGFPGIPFPMQVEILALDQKQFFVISQIATKSLGSSYRLSEIINQTSFNSSPNVFNFDILGTLEVRDKSLLIFAHCRHQRSPVRLEQINEVIRRKQKYKADITLLFYTSTSSLNGVEDAIRNKIAPVLITSRYYDLDEKTKDPGIVILSNSDVVQYPAHSFWIPIKYSDKFQYKEIRKRQQVLDLVLE